MAKLCLNSRDELVLIDLDTVVLFQADGNYTKLMYVGGLKQTLSMGLSKLELCLKAALPEGKSNFIRLGRSMIINQKYLYSINMTTHKLFLGDFNSHLYGITAPKPLLKAYKEKMGEMFNPKKS
jgi:DNA-binding LytR/AlgR family response regulator